VGDKMTDSKLASMLAVGAMFSMGINDIPLHEYRNPKFRDMKTPLPSSKRANVKKARKQNRKRKSK